MAELETNLLRPDESQGEESDTEYHATTKREDQQEEPPATEEPQQEPDPNTWDAYDWQRVWADPGYFLGGDS